VITKEATDENRHKATEARHGGIEGDIGQAGLRPGRQALDAVMLERGRLVAESLMRIERTEIAGPDYYPNGPVFQTVPGHDPSGRRGVPLWRDGVGPRSYRGRARGAAVRSDEEGGVRQP